MNQEQYEAAKPLIEERDSLRTAKTGLAAGNNAHFKLVDEAFDNDAVKASATAFIATVNSTDWPAAIDTRLGAIDTALADLDYDEDETPA